MKPLASRRLAPVLRAPVLLALLSLASCRSAGTGESSSAPPLTVSRPALGTVFRVTVYAPNPGSGNEAIAAALRRLDEVDAALNTDRPDGELSRLNATGEGVAVKLGNDLFAVLQHAQRLSTSTRGAFDVTAGPYADLWRRTAAAGRAPTAAELENVRLRVGRDKLSLNPIERTATLTVPGMRLDASGIARGYAADQMFRQLRAHGCERAKIDAGHVVVAGDAPPGREGWQLVVYGSAPAGRKQRTITGSRTAMAFSPNAAIAKGHRAGVPTGVPRLIDPVSGRALDDRPPAAVMATGGAIAESVALAAAVLGPGSADVLAAAEGAARIRFDLPNIKAARRRGT